MNTIVVSPLGGPGDSDTMGSKDAGTRVRLDDMGRQYTKSSFEIRGSKRRFTTTQLDIADALRSAIVTVEDKKHGVRFIVSKHNTFRVWWDIIVILTLLYVFIFTPLELTYDNPSSPAWVNIGRIVDVLFWMDILVSFRTTYYDSGSGREVWNSQQIAAQYLKGFFLIDLAGSAPGYPLGPLIESAFTGVQDTSLVKLSKAPRALKIIRSTKMLKMLRMLKIGTLFEDFRDSFPNVGVFTKMVKLVALGMFFLHLNACAFSMVARAGGPTHDTWLTQINGNRDEWLSEYLHALYWATTTSTTVGYGDITPQNDSEKIFCIISMCISVGIYGFVIGSMTEVATNISHVERVKKQKMDQVYELISRHQLPKDLSILLVRFFRRHFEKRSLCNGDERKLMKSMPQTLLQRCHEVVMRRYLCNVEFFQSLGPAYFPDLVELLVPMSTEGTIIEAEKSPPSRNFYVLLEGTVGVYEPVDSANTRVATHSENVAKYMEVIRALYDEHCGTTNGRMGVAELQELLTNLFNEGILFSQVEQLMRKIDTDRNGTIELSEFVEWYVVTKVEGSTNAEENLCSRGHCLRILKPVCTFGTYSAFGIGLSKFSYITREMCDMYAISTEALMETFRDTPAVLDAVETSFISRAEYFGPEIDVNDLEQDMRPGMGMDMDSSAAKIYPMDGFKDLKHLKGLNEIELPPAIGGPRSKMNKYMVEKKNIDSSNKGDSETTYTTKEEDTSSGCPKLGAGECPVMGLPSQEKILSDAKEAIPKPPSPKFLAWSSSRPSSRCDPEQTSAPASRSRTMWQRASSRSRIAELADQFEERMIESEGRVVAMIAATDDRMTAQLQTLSAQVQQLLKKCGDKKA